MKKKSLVTNCYECGAVMKEEKIRHHYKECGLDYVYLDNISRFTCPACKIKFVSVSQPIQLHILMATAIASREGMLTGDEIRFLRKEIDMSSKAFAEKLGVPPQTLSRWENSPGNANKTKSHDQLIRATFKWMMGEKLKTLISYLEEQIRQYALFLFHRKILDVRTDALKHINVPRPMEIDEKELAA